MSSGSLISRLSVAAGRTVSRETYDRLERFAALLKSEAARQNLVSASTLDQLWERHIVDSAQLMAAEPKPGASWLDIGSGAGLPGIVIACLADGPVSLAEPRRLRAEFLSRVVAELHLEASVLQTKAERLSGQFDVITARAVASLRRLLEISHHLSTRKTVWALPKGRSAQSELAEAQRAWHGTFHVKQSATDRDSFIIVATGVRPR